MNTCGDNCIQVCDYCKHYNDIGGFNKYTAPNSQFIGEGTCAKNNKRVNADEGRKCKDFDCFNCN